MRFSNLVRAALPALVVTSLGCGGSMAVPPNADAGRVEDASTPEDAGHFEPDAGASDASSPVDARVPESDAGAEPDAGGPITRVPGCTKQHPAGRTTLHFEIAGVTREAVIYVPNGYTGEEPLPLTFNLHGSGGNAAGQLDYTGMEPVADQKGFLVAALQGYEGKWNVARKPELPDDVALAEAVLDWASENLCVDPARVFSTGYSGGARTSSRFACALPGRIRAIAPVAGIRHDPPCDVAGVPVLTFHGTADGTNYYGGCNESDTACSRNGEWVEGVEAAVSDWRVANGCGDTPRVESISDKVERRTFGDCSTGADVVFYRVVDGTHVWPLLPNTTELVLDFFLAQPRR